VSFPCRIVDLSLGGCRIETRERFLAGRLMRVEVSFRARGLALQFNGITQWTDGHCLLGVRFVDVPHRRMDELAEVLGEVKEVNAAKAVSAAVEKQAAKEQACQELDDLAEGQCEGQAADPLANAETAPEPAITAPVLTESPLGEEPEVVAGSTVAIAEQAPQENSAGQGTDLAETVREDREGKQAIPLVDPTPSATVQVAAPPVVEEQLSAPPGAEATGGSQATAKPSKRERRAQSRHGVDTSALIYLINVGSRLPGRIVDLSLSGCRIRTDERFPVGIYTRVETEFRLQGLPFRLGGVIQAVHDHDRHNVGIRFLDVSARKREQVEQLIEEIEEMDARLEW